MADRSLQQAFNAIYHDSESFDDFCNFPLGSEISQVPLHEREVYQPSDKLKVYLRFIDKIVLRHLACNKRVVHSYIKEKSSLTAVQAHAKSHAFFLSDIKSFFPNIGEEGVRRILKRDFHRVPISDIDKYLEKLVRYTTVDGKLPVGFPTSPKLSNGFLYEFDEALDKYCESRELVYTRYSDDIIVSGMNRDVLIDLKDRIQSMLSEFASDALCLNEKKTRITHRGNKVKILGLVITQDGRVTIDTKYKDAIESLLHFYSTDSEKFTDLLNKTFTTDNKERSLFGMLHYARSCDPEYLLKLQKKYGVLALRTLMEDKWSGNR
ncbi:reverse transcriptase domain-containing protein [Teredinibacter turnerae]|uniref:reverse transcriptase domain-containing protein n=1 Tax=Teredinibacter turnerae TaxID=2426 RepID=UPI0030CAEB39